MSTFERVKQILVDMGHRVDAISEDARFIEDLGLDSLDTFEVVMFAEEEFRITISDDQAAKINTVGEFVKLVDLIQAEA